MTSLDFVNVNFLFHLRIYVRKYVNLCHPDTKTAHCRAKSFLNKNAFQEDAYRLLHWPLGGGGVCPGGYLAKGGLPSGVSAKGGGVCHTPPVNRMTGTCKNITLPQLHCRW